MRFFNDINAIPKYEFKYLLVKIKHYKPIYKEMYDYVIIDPGVYQLKKQNEYDDIDKLHYLANGHLAPNEFITIDYPCDMNVKESDLFIRKSIENNIKYADNPQYICTIQSKFKDFEDFKYRFEELKPIFYNKNKMVGIGNICRIIYDDIFAFKTMKYLYNNMDGIYWLHIFGMGLRLIRKYLYLFENYNISIDSTKWKRAVTREIKYKHGLNVGKDTMLDFFLPYMDIINQYIPVDW